VFGNWSGKGAVSGAKEAPKHAGIGAASGLEPLGVKREPTRGSPIGCVGIESTRRGGAGVRAGIRRPFRTGIKRGQSTCCASSL